MVRPRKVKRQPLIFGKVGIPIDSQHLQSGSYASISWKKVKKHALIKIHPPSYGNPLLEERESKKYSFSSR